MLICPCRIASMGTVRSISFVQAFLPGIRVITNQLADVVGIYVSRSTWDCQSTLSTWTSTGLERAGSRHWVVNSLIDTPTAHNQIGFSRQIIIGLRIPVQSDAAQRQGMIFVHHAFFPAAWLRPERPCPRLIWLLSQPFPICSRHLAAIWAFRIVRAAFPAGHMLLPRQPAFGLRAFRETGQTGCPSGECRSGFIGGRDLSRLDGFPLPGERPECPPLS